MTPTLHIHLLGDFLLMSGDTPVTTVNVPRLQSLLAYLLLHRTAPQARTQLAFLLWPDSTEAQAHTNLRKLLHQLRQALPDADHFIHADKHSLQWLPEDSDVSWTLDILDSEDAVVRGLDELWQRRIVREQGAGTAETYDFSHDKLREQAYASLSPAHRRLLHRRVAEAFEVASADTLSGGQVNLDAVSGQIATHYEHAGLPERAIPYYRLAGEVAMRIYANAEAITAFQRAAALLEADSPGHTQQAKQWEIATGVYTSLGDIFTMTGRYQEARQVYQRAITCTPASAYIWQARLQRKLANTWQHSSDNPQDTFHVNTRQAFQQAERILEQASVKSSREWSQERRRWAISDNLR